VSLASDTWQAFQDQGGWEQTRTHVKISIVSLAIASGLGIALGIVFVKSQVLSWYRIQEMFRFQAFHMYALLGSAFFTALISTQILKRLGARARTGEPIALAPKQLGRGYRYAFGGAIFGVGWALSGACPGPVFALIGSGTTVYIVTLLSAIAGTWTYGYLRPRLPH
jgi:uncharacterized membrane protein YedE/YeeE